MDVGRADLKVGPYVCNLGIVRGDDKQGVKPSESSGASYAPDKPSYASGKSPCL